VRHYFGFRAGHYTYVSGFLAKDIYVNDSLLVLAEPDWFVGPKASSGPICRSACCGATYPAILPPLLAQDVL
jgi:hypothetical protein